MEKRMKTFISKSRRERLFPSLPNLPSPSLETSSPCNGHLLLPSSPPSLLRFPQKNFERRQVTYTLIFFLNCRIFAKGRRGRKSIEGRKLLSSTSPSLLPPSSFSRFSLPSPPQLPKIVRSSSTHPYPSWTLSPSRPSSRSSETFLPPLATPPTMSSSRAHRSSSNNNTGNPLGRPNSGGTGRDSNEPQFALPGDPASASRRGGGRMQVSSARPSTQTRWREKQRLTISSLLPRRFSSKVRSSRWW